MRSGGGWSAVARAGAAILAVAGAGRAHSAQVPKGSEVLTVDLVPGKFGAVRFEHARHNDAFTRPDGTRVRCRDCHHALAADEPASPDEDMKCSNCHARYGDPPKTIRGKVAPVLAAVRPDGAMEYRSILFHHWCWDCHHKTIKDDGRNDRCKFCHERGIGSDTIHGRFDATRQPGTKLSWMNCDAGARWTGHGCEGAPLAAPWSEAVGACPPGYRLPTRAEVLGLRPPPPAPAGTGTYWTAEGEGESAWTVRLDDGATALAKPSAAARARCVRTEKD